MNCENFHTVVRSGKTNGGNTVKADCDCSNEVFCPKIGRVELKSKKGELTV
jgi:hypothetical protein